MISRTTNTSIALHRTSRAGFSTSSHLATHKTNPLVLLAKDAPPPPSYPYGRSHFYKQRDTGLYGGVMIQFGNNVAAKSAVKTRRRWIPNIVHKKLYSEALDRKVTVKISTRVLRTIDKVGGLDNYLLGGTSARLKDLGELGWQLRWAVLQAPSMKDRLKTDPKLKHAAIHMEQIKQIRGTSPAAAVAAQPIEITDAPSTADAIDAARTMVVEEPSEVYEEEQDSEGLAARVRRNLSARKSAAETSRSPTLWQRAMRLFGR